MIKPAIITSFFALVGIGCMLAPVGVAARSIGSHVSVHAPSQKGQVWHHRKANRFMPYGYSYSRPYPYSDSDDDDALSPSKQKPVAEARRGCEPQSYSVPATSGGESKVTILRC